MTHHVLCPEVSRVIHSSKSLMIFVETSNGFAESPSDNSFRRSCFSSTMFLGVLSSRSPCQAIKSGSLCKCCFASINSCNNHIAGLNTPFSSSRTQLTDQANLSTHRYWDSPFQRNANHWILIETLLHKQKQCQIDQCALFAIDWNVML